MSTEQISLTLVQRMRFFKEINQNGDHIIGVSLVAMFGFGFFLATFYDTYFFAVAVGGLNLTAYFVSKWILPHTSFYRYVASAVFAVFMAQFIYQMHGMFEMHFFAFVGAALLIAYRNWKLQIPNILVVVIHHAGFAYLQYTGMKEIYFTQLDYMTLQSFLFHGSLAALIVGICGYWGYKLNHDTVKEALNTLQLENQLENMNKSRNFAEEISKGNLEVNYDLSNETDILGASLMRMQKSLLLASEKEQRDKFVNIGYTKVSEVLRANQTENITLLADRVLLEIVNYLKVNQGVMFIVKTEEGNTFLQQESAYAYGRKKHLNRRMEIGEGLVGQAYLEKDTIYLTDIPNNYIKITSGLGEALPRNVVIVPLISNEEVIGVIELASFNLLEEKEMEYLHSVSETIASSLVSVRVNHQTKVLLTESQMTTEQMRAQEEEMRQNMEELQATQEEMNRKASEYEELLEQKEHEIESLKKRLKLAELSVK